MDFLKVRGKRWLFLLVFFGATLVNVAYFYSIERVRMESELKRSSQVLKVFLEGLSRSISTGYFQWDDFYEALSSGDEKFIKENLRRVEGDFPHVKGAKIVKRPEDISKDGLYHIKIEDNAPFIYFNVWDTEVKRVIEDRVAKVELDLLGLCDALDISRYFIPDPHGKVEIFGIRFTSKVPILKRSQILFSLAFGAIVAILIASILSFTLCPLLTNFRTSS